MTPWTVAGQAPLSMEFSRQEYWSGLPFSSPGDLPDPGIEPGCPALEADSLPSEPPGKFLFIADCIFVQPCIFVLHLLYPFISDGHLGGFYVLATVNTIAVNTKVQVSF